MQKKTPIIKQAAPKKTRRALITGISGFVGRHVAQAFSQQGYEVSGFDVTAAYLERRVFQGDLLQRGEIEYALKQVRPDVVIHLAGVIKSDQPKLLYEANALATLSLFESLASLNQRPVVVAASSSAVYGAGNGHTAIDETCKPQPLTHYAASKLAQEMIALRYFHALRMPVIIARMFNIIGPGQPQSLALSSFARQIAQAERLKKNHITTGDLSAYRDFLDVRDAARAFLMLAENGAAGEVYNVCSARAVTVRLCLDELLSMSARKIRVQRDKRRVQSHDVSIQVGSARKIKAAVGWRPQISLKDSLADLLNDWRVRIDKEEQA